MIYMAKKKIEKVNKNLFLPGFVAEELDTEGELYGGPGAVAAAAIYHFCHSDNSKKGEIMLAFREMEIRAAYADEVDDIVSEAEAAAQKQRLGRKPLESA